MAYQGFLISNFSTGYQTTKQPWLAPADAFVTLENARCEDGILKKREGTLAMAQMKHGAAVQTTSITGLHCHNSQKSQFLIACDTARPNVYDPSAGAMIDVSGGSDIFDGTNQDMFWFLTFDDVTYMSNNYDVPYKFVGDDYDPTGSYAVVEFNLDLNAAGTSKMTAYNMLFHLNDRLLAYDIVEDGDHKAYRLRYTQALARGNTPVFTDGYYLDVPTDDTPVTGRRLGRYVYLWHEHSLWMIRPTGDTDVPYKPDFIRGDMGSQSPRVCIPFDKGFLTVGHKDLYHFDGYEVRPANLPHLNNILDQFEWAALKYSHGIHDKTNKRIYITFAASGSTYPDRVLEYSLTEKLACVHLLDAHTMTMFNGHSIPLWNAADDAYSAIAKNQQTSGTLTVGDTYRIENWLSDDDFTNVGGTNVDDNEFVASGTTPTKWTNSSVLANITLSAMPIASTSYGFDREAYYPVYGGRDGFIYRMFTGTRREHSQLCVHGQNRATESVQRARAKSRSG